MRLLPCAVLIGLSLWGLLSPRTNWRVLWGWQRRYRHVKEHEREEFVMQNSVTPLILGVVLAIVMLLV